MKIINNTTGPLHWDTSYTGGGDCGDIPAGAAPVEVHVPAGASVSVRIPDIAYAVDDPDGTLIVTSRYETGQR